MTEIHVLEMRKGPKAHITDSINDYWRLGLGPAIPMSAIHGHGAGDILDHIFEYIQEHFPSEEEEEEEEESSGKLIH